MSFVTTWRKLGGIILSKISQTEKKILYGITQCRMLKKKESQTHRNRVKKWLQEAGGWGKQGEAGKKSTNFQL